MVLSLTDLGDSLIGSENLNKEVGIDLGRDIAARSGRLMHPIIQPPSPDDEDLYPPFKVFYIRLSELLPTATKIANERISQFDIF